MLSLLSPGFWLAALLSLGGAFSAGVYAHMRWTEAEPVKAALEVSETNREIEHENTTTAIRKLDNFIAVQQGNGHAAVRDAALVASVQRDFASVAAVPASGASSSCPADPRLGRISDLASEGAGLLAEGVRHLEELRAKRDALK